MCSAHLWGRSGCSRTLEWHTAPSSEALSCHQQNAQSEPATYCKAQKRICVIRVMCTVPTYVRTCVTCTICTHHTLYTYMCTSTPTHTVYTHAHAHPHPHTHTHTHLSVFKQALLPLLGGQESHSHWTEWTR